jgi:DNA-binding SARP family transcriptional activator/WD40 repeat protein
MQAVAPRLRRAVGLLTTTVCGADNPGVPKIEFRILGPLEVTRAGRPIGLGGERQHALLALLLLRANEVVPSEWIVEELFRGVARDPANALQVAISRLRRSLTDGVLETRPRGYLLRAGPEEFDRTRFERLAEQGRLRLAAGEVEDAAGTLAEALKLWRGSPLQEVAVFDFAQAEIRRLEELRLTATLDRIDADLALGRADELVPELERLVAARPLQERPRGQLMLALYRAGRQADALAVYRQTRELLREELGLEPSRALQRLERALLNQDDELERERAAYVPAPDTGICPFKGLAAYDGDDADFFFGRERLVADLVAKLAASPFVGVVGSSGSGKSSLLRAGLLSTLRSGGLPGSDEWPQQLLRPGDPIDPSARVVAVDPLEEAFAEPEAERARFFDALVAATAHARVVVCLRADFYGRCAEHRGLAELLSNSQALVGPMEPDEVRRAIELPAARAGLEVEPPLVDALVAEVEGEPGALPLLSTMLLELWRLRGGGILRFETYRAAGGVHGAVARLAEETYAQLSEAERDAARRILLRLADQGPDAPVRRRVPLAQLGDTAVLETLAEARLVTISDGSVEVAHEALLRDWPRLRDWLEADAGGRRIRRELAAHAAAWEAHGRDTADLYRAARLSVALDWADAHPSDANESERDFLAASRRAARQEVRRLRGLAVVLTTLLGVALVAGVVAVVQRTSARHDARTALAARLGAQAIAEPRLDRAALLARESVRLDDTPATEQALLATLLRSPALVASYALPEGTRPYRITASRDGRTLVVGDSEGALRLFDARTRRETRPPFRGAFGFLPTAYTPDGTKLVAVADPPRALAVLDAKTLQRLRLLPLDSRFSPDKAGAVAPLVVNSRAAFFAYDLVIDSQGDEGPAFLDRLDLRSGRRTSVRLGSPDVVGAGLVNGRLVTVTSRLVETWDPRTLRRLRAVRVGGRLGGYAAVDPTGRYVVGLGRFASATVIVFVNLRTGHVTPATGAEAAAGALAVGFSPDGSRAVTAGPDGKVTLWDPSTGSALDTFDGHSGAANGVAFSPDGRTLYASSLDGTVLAWAVEQARRFDPGFAVPPQPTSLPNVPQTPPVAVTRSDAVVRDGNGLAACPLASLASLGCRPLARSTGRLATALAATATLLAVGRAGGGVELWPGGRPGRRLRGLATNVQSLALAPSVPRLAGAGLRTLAVWNTSTGALEYRHELPATATTVAFSPDSRRVAVGLADGRVVVTTVDGDTTLTLHPHGAPNVSVAFLPDGTLVTGSFAGALERWDLHDGRRLSVAPAAPTGPVAGIAVSPGGAYVLTSSLTSGTIREWSSPGLQLLAEFPGDPFVPTGVAVTPDSRTALAVSSDGHGVAWPLDRGAWVARACRVAGRQLTLAEWRQFLPGRRPTSVCP